MNTDNMTLSDIYDHMLVFSIEVIADNGLKNWQHLPHYVGNTIYIGNNKIIVSSQNKAKNLVRYFCNHIF